MHNFYANVLQVLTKIDKNKTNELTSGQSNLKC